MTIKFESVAEPVTYFIPLFHSPNPWISEVPDMEQVASLTVKITARPVEDLLLQVEEVDIFTIGGYMPPYPKTKVNQFMLIDTICNALSELTERSVLPFPWSRVIYDGRAK